MIVNFMNVNRDGTAANPDATLLADENAAKAILESTFFNNITLTFNVGMDSTHSMEGTWSGRVLGVQTLTFL